MLIFYQALSLEVRCKAALYIKYELTKNGQTDLFPLEETNIKIIESNERNQEYNVNIHNIAEEKRIIK